MTDYYAPFEQGRDARRRKTGVEAAYDFFGGMEATQARDAARKKRRFEAVVPHGGNATKSSYPGQHPTRLSAQETADRLNKPRGTTVQGVDARPPTDVAKARARAVASHAKVTNPLGALGMRRPRTVTTTSRSSAPAPAPAPAMTIPPDPEHKYGFSEESKKRARDERKAAWEKRKEEQAASRKKKHENRMEGMTRYLAEMESRRKVTRAKVRPRRRLTGTEYNRNRRQHDPGPLRSL